MERTGKAVRWVPGSEYSNFVPSPDQMLGERLNVPVDAALIRPRIGTDESDTHLYEAA